MCPFCIATTALMAASVVSTGGVTAFVMKKLAAKGSTKEFVQNPNPKEERWEK